MNIDNKLPPVISELAGAKGPRTPPAPGTVARCLVMAGLAVVLAAVSCGRVGSVGYNAFSINSKQASEERHLTVPHLAHSRLELSTSFGAISVAADATLTNVEVTAAVQAGGPTLDEARANLAKIVVSTERRPDNTLEIRAQFPNDRGFSGGCSLTVRIPDAEGVKATTSNGQVTLTGLGGSAEAATSFGGVTVKDQHGPVAVRTANGSIDLHNVAGNVRANTSFGSIKVIGAQGTVEAGSQNGKVEVAEVTGPVQITTSFGSVTVHDVGGRVSVKTSNGGIKVEKTKGNITAHTSFGSVEARDAAGEADLGSVNGPITYVPSPGNEQLFSLRTSFGHVKVHLPASAKGTIQAGTSFGSIKVKGSRRPLSVTGDDKHKQIVLTEAGPESRVQTSNGSIEVELDQLLAEKE